MKPSYTEKLKAEFEAGPAYKNPAGRQAIDVAILKMREAEEAGKKDEVARLTEELAKELERILASPAGSLEIAELYSDFERQFMERSNELDKFGVVSMSNPWIKGIDGNDYPPPSWEQIKAGFTPEKVELIAQLKKPTLLLVPYGMSLLAYLNKIKAHKEQPKMAFSYMSGIPTHMNDDKKGEMISDALVYDTTKHKGKTKTERLQEPGALGWQVLVVDGEDEVPEETQGRTADDLLNEFRGKGFGGLSVEASFALFMHGQVRGKPFDTIGTEWLLESYLTSPPTLAKRGQVLASTWCVTMARINAYSPNDRDRRLGARRSVRIL